MNALGTDVKAMYSTPSEYTYARNAEGLTWNVKTDDFFPYGISAHAYRTGFYTSRPALKRYVRVLSHWLQAARQLEVVSGGDGSGTRALWEAMGVVQHHDAVSGTERQHVAYNYAYLLAKGSVSAFATAQSAIAGLSTQPGSAPLAFTTCPLLNVSLCPPTQSSSAQAVLLYNSLSRNVTTTVRLPSNASAVQVFDATGRQLTAAEFDVLPTPITQATPAGAAPFTVFVQAQVPALGWTTLFLQPSTSSADDPAQGHRHSRAKQAVVGGEEEKGVRVGAPEQRWALVFNNVTRMLESVTDTASGRSYRLRQDFLYYNSMQDNGQNSGAYIFRPREQTAVVAQSAVVNTASSNTSVVTWVHQVINPWISQTIILSSASPFIEFRWTVGPIDVSDAQGKEVITRFTTDIGNNATWYTDANGREFQRRVRNYRQTYPWEPTEPVAGNYFPVTSAVWMADASEALVLAVDRSEGASSLVDGQLELMLHRRTLRSDDGETVEALNETDAIEGPHSPTPPSHPAQPPSISLRLSPSALLLSASASAADGRTRVGRGLVVTGSFLLSIVPPGQAAVTARTGHQAQYSPVIPFFAPVSAGAIPSYLSSHVATWSFLATPLPAQLELITMQAFSAGRVLIRLAHVYGVGDDAALSLPASVNLLTLFSRAVVEVVELSLSGNSAAGSHVPLVWKTNETAVDLQEGARTRAVRDTFDGVTVTLSAMEVRTFAIRFAAK